MARKYLLADYKTGKIYEAELTGLPGVYKKANKRDRTGEAIFAVMQHMDVEAKRKDGIFEYHKPGFGTLTWKVDEK